MQGRDKNIPLLCRGHSRPVRQVYHSKITPDGFFIVSACIDSKPMLREGKTGDWIGTFEGHKGAVWSAYVNNDVTLALTASADFTAKVWNAITGEELISFTHKHIVKTASFSREEDKIVTGGMAKTLQIYDLQRPDAAPQVLSPTCSDSIKTALYRPDGNTIVSVEDKLLRVWDVRTLTQVEERRVKGAVTSLAFTGGNDRLLSLTYADHVQFLDPSTLNVVKEFGMPVGANSASVHPDGNRFVIGGVDFYVYVYDYNSGEQLEVHKGHHGPVHSVSYAPDGETYASGSEDGTIRIWQNEVKPYELWQSTGGANGAAAPAASPSTATATASAEATASSSDSSTPASDS